ncbi:MAG: uridine phosphorylase [Clostridiales Family XIII bacterium]|jgi:uridine phosphorylase|nr:uridine phosphorylase [Clostridiales Family XIII bacterium]
MNKNTRNTDERKPMYHIGIDGTHGAKYAILPGDPGRVESIAHHLDNPHFLARSREYTSYIGSLEGENVIVMSTGMGGPSTAICVEELYQTGVRTFIRIGTCGGMNLDVIPGDLVIANAAIRMEGTSKEYVPIEFPAISNIEVTNALISAAKNVLSCNQLSKANSHHVGIVQCKDSFYGQHSPERMPIGDELMSKWHAWIKAGCLASEMESATLFIVSQILGARAGCVLNVIWNQERANAGIEDTESPDMSNAIAVSIEAMRQLIVGDKADFII